MSRFVLLSLLGLALAGLADTGSGSPELVLWAWERPEDLGFVDADTGVAVLVGTLVLSGERLRVVPRRQPLRVPAPTPVLAVVRIETREPRPRLDRDQRTAAAEAIERLAGGAGYAGLQIDFDATTSERAFYRGLLVELRGRLPAGRFLGITALASWCWGEPWIDGLPIDEAVPMLFRMGADGPGLRRSLAEGQDFRVALCRTSAGVSTDEPWPRLPTGRRIYLFHPRAWTEGEYRLARETLKTSSENAR